MPGPTRPLHLAVALDTAGCQEADIYVELARLAERGALDFVTLDDSAAPAGETAGRLDALAVLARVAPATERIGLVPTVSAERTEPARVAASLAALDRASRGRAGWTVDVAAPRAANRPAGARPAAEAALWAEADDAAGAVARLWDSGEDGAEVRDTVAGRVVGHDGPRRGDSPSAFRAVRGPSVLPRSPQGRPVIAVDATTGPGRETAARHADLVLVRAEDPDTARAVGEELRDRARAHGREPGRPAVFVSLPVELRTPADAVGLAHLIGDWYAAGAADGFHLRPADTRRDLGLIVDGTVPVLQHRSLLRRFYPGSTLREHLGLGYPAGRCAAVGGAPVAGR
ncbi:LLM class flavin-dependent oxidoreductase [Streptomyces sp. NPDC001922]|uniref:LLM class flavin-dependent oxidoreductase n=1 Tax=Streptomyces sp. NPDC001922 TaxID=3364624 RepID=UPI00369CD5E3